MISNTSNIIAGTMNWGAWGSKLSTFAMQERIETYLSENIITFDHADIYGGYTTETDFGKAWKNMSIARENVRFVTKCGIKMIAENREYGSKHYDYSKKHIIWSVENSLKNLQTEYKDVLLLHRPSP
jgi:predicted oxidoreductase